MAASEKQHDADTRSAPRLAIYSLPIQKLDSGSTPAGWVTPPLHPPVSVPFLWEEEPGRPRPWVAKASSVARRYLVLDLPPRLINSSSNNNHNSTATSNQSKNFPVPVVSPRDDNSPTSVLIDPYGGGLPESPTTFDVEGERGLYGASRARALDYSKGDRRRGGGGRIGKWLMALWLRPNRAKAKRAAADGEATFELVGADGGDGGGGASAAVDDGPNKAKITRFTRKSSFTASHLVVSIYGSFKHMVSPRRKKTNSGLPRTPLSLPPSGSN